MRHPLENLRNPKNAGMPKTPKSILADPDHRLRPIPMRLLTPSIRNNIATSDKADGIFREIFMANVEVTGDPLEAADDAGMFVF